jgi:hypothetical protein
MVKNVHAFINTVPVYESQFLPHQKGRYAKNNDHEQEEEGNFVDIVRKLSPSDIFVNFATDVGYYQILVKTIRKDIDVHCFEPLNRHMDCFRANYGIERPFQPRFFYLSNCHFYYKLTGAF